eukprot:1697342-Pyramimonas_sp.AAC.1
MCVISPHCDRAWPPPERSRYILTTDQSDAERADIFSRRTNQMCVISPHCNRAWPPPERSRYILTTDQPDAGRA